VQIDYHDRGALVLNLADNRIRGTHRKSWMANHDPGRTGGLRAILDGQLLLLMFRQDGNCDTTHG